MKRKLLSPKVGPLYFNEEWKVLNENYQRITVIDDDCTWNAFKNNEHSISLLHFENVRYDNQRVVNEIKFLKKSEKQEIEVKISSMSYTI